MKRKALSLIISFILATSLSVNVKATDVSTPSEVNPSTDGTTLELPEQINPLIGAQPEITLENNTVNREDVFSLELLAPTALDSEDGDLSSKIELISSEVKLGETMSKVESSSFKVVLGVTDKDNNETQLEATIEIMDAPTTTMTLSSYSANETKTIAGLDRFQTATAISQAMYSSANTAILVSSENFPDALSAGPLSVSLQAPILLTPKATLSSHTEKELTRLGVQKIVIMGGTVAISKEVENSLVAKGMTIERISGDDRYATAIAAAQKLVPPTKIFLADGANFADAMSAGSYASKNGYPIILTNNAVLSPSTSTYLSSTTAEIIIVGGVNAISAKIETDLKAKGKTVTRIYGETRFTTAVEMAKKFYTSAPMAVVANGMNFVDALTAVPYAASMNAPILLTNRDTVDAGVSGHLVESQIENFHFIGGDGVISANVKNNMSYPSLYDLSYSTADLSGTWGSAVKNGQTSGITTSNGISLFDMGALGSKDVKVRYGVSVKGLGWQNIVESGTVGVKGKPIDGIIMELNGKDAVNFDVSYRAYLQNSGWSAWTLGGKSIGTSGGSAILAVESRIIKGSTKAIDKYLFPKNPLERTYAYTTTTLNLRSGEGTSYPVVVSMVNRGSVDIISINKNTNWAKLNYTNNGVTYTGYASMAYIKTEKLTANAILTVKGLINGESVPKNAVTITGDAAYSKGISQINYYINGSIIGQADYGHLTSGGIKYGFDAPEKTGYAISIPSNSWSTSKMNSLKIEMVGTDGTKEWETVYVGGNSKDIITMENYDKSFNYYVKAEYNQGTFPADDVAKYMDPSTWASNDTYKYMFLDLRYSPSDYTVTAAQIDAMIKGKGVLDGMGSTFLQAAIDFKINPFYLVAHAILETGHGKSVLANGQTFTHYHEKFGTAESALIPLSPEDAVKTWYNMFGIGAYNRNAVMWGGERAYHEGWDTIEKSLYGGAKWISMNYLNRSPEPQNTLYKMRYNLKEGMSHQYATDIMWAHKQAANIKKQFDTMGVDVPLKFIVPVFNDLRP